MYDVSDKRSAIKVLQRYLNKLYGNELSISQNGIFDESTILALNKFQKDNNLDITDHADRETFSALYSSYVEKDKELELKKRNPNLRFPIKRGESSPFIANINYIMREILMHYSIYWITPGGDYFSSTTEEAVKALRDIFEFKSTNVVDEMLYLRLKDEFESISMIKRSKGDYFQ